MKKENKVALHLFMTIIIPFVVMFALIFLCRIDANKVLSNREGIAILFITYGLFIILFNEFISKYKSWLTRKNIDICL